MIQEKTVGFELQRVKIFFMLGLRQKNTLRNRVLAEGAGFEPAEGY